MIPALRRQGRKQEHCPNFEGRLIKIVSSRLAMAIHSKILSQKKRKAKRQTKNPREKKTELCPFFPSLVTSCPFSPYQNCSILALVSSIPNGQSKLLNHKSKCSELVQFLQCPAELKSHSHHSPELCAHLIPLPIQTKDTQLAFHFSVLSAANRPVS